MKKLFLLALAIISIAVAAYYVLGGSRSTGGFDGHNGIRFDMKQKDIEAKGFVCRPRKEKITHIHVECNHMDMTGVAFGFPTKDYNVTLGSTGKVTFISADFSGNINTSEYLGLNSKIELFFPNKIPELTMYSEVARIDHWRDKNNFAAVLLLTAGVEPYISQKLKITFWSPLGLEQSGKK
jgi:hypothetical protein